MKAGFWSKMLSVFSNPFIDSELYLVRYATKKNVEYKLNLFSINSPSGFRVCLEIIIPSAGELDFWLVHRMISKTSASNIFDNSVSTGPLVSQTFLLRKI